MPDKLSDDWMPEKESDQVRCIKADLEEWEWGTDDTDDVPELKNLIERLCRKGAEVVIDQLVEDLKEAPAICDFREDGGLSLWKLVFNHLIVRIDFHEAVEGIAEDYEEEEVRNLVAILRKLADKIESEIPVNDVPRT